MRVAAHTYLAIALCLFLIQASARFGFSRLLTRYALISNSVSVADRPFYSTLPIRKHIARIQF